MIDWNIGEGIATHTGDIPEHFRQETITFTGNGIHYAGSRGAPGGASPEESEIIGTVASAVLCRCGRPQMGSRRRPLAIGGAAVGGLG